MSTLRNISRRQFVEGMFSTGAFVLAARVLPEPVWAQTPAFRTRAQSSALSRPPRSGGLAAGFATAPVIVEVYPYASVEDSM